MTTASDAVTGTSVRGDIPEPPGETLPSAGLEWACRLLFGYGGDDSATVVAVPGTPSTPARRVSPPAGYRHAESYLAVPRASDPRVLVPLGSKQAAAAVLRTSHDASSRQSRMAKTLLAAGLRVGVAQRVLRDRVDLAVRTDLPDARLGEHLLTAHLSQLFGRRDLQVAVLLGPPRLNRKPVLQILTDEGQVVGYVKASWNDLTSRLVNNEARVLGSLRAREPRAFETASIVHHGTWRDLELLATTALPNTSKPSPALAFDPPMAVIAEIADLEGRTEGPLDASAYWSGIRDRLDRRLKMPSAAPDSLAGIADHIEARYGNVELSFGTWHGDFTAWNMARLEQGTYVWDWERCAPAPVGLDLLHFLFQSACRFEGRKPSEAVETCRERTPGLLASLHAIEGSESAMWSLYCLELLFRYDEARLAGALFRPSRIHTGILEMFAREMEAV